MYFSVPSSGRSPAASWARRRRACAGLLDLCSSRAVERGELLLQRRGRRGRRCRAVAGGVGDGRRGRRRGRASARRAARLRVALRSACGTTRVVGARRRRRAGGAGRRGRRRGAAGGGSGDADGGARSESGRRRRRAARGGTAAGRSAARSRGCSCPACPGTEMTMFVARGRDLGLGDAEAVDPAADDGDRLVERLLRDLARAPFAARGVRMTLVPPSRSRPSRGWYFVAPGVSCPCRSSPAPRPRSGRRRSDDEQREHREGAPGARRARVLPREDLFSVSARRDVGPCAAAGAGYSVGAVLPAARRRRCPSAVDGARRSRRRRRRPSRRRRGRPGRRRALAIRRVARRATTSRTTESSRISRTVA